MRLKAVVQFSFILLDLHNFAVFALYVSTYVVTMQIKWRQSSVLLNDFLQWHVFHPLCIKNRQSFKSRIYCFSSSNSFSHFTMEKCTVDNMLCYDYKKTQSDIYSPDDVNINIYISFFCVLWLPIKCYHYIYWYTLLMTVHKQHCAGQSNRFILMLPSPAFYILQFLSASGSEERQPYVSF